MDEFTTSDVAACLWHTGFSDHPNIVVISVYADITKPTISEELIKLLSFCASKRYPVIMAVDTNSHSETWGCPVNNKRGDDFEVFISCQNLHLLNHGSLPTFQTVRAQSIIDITLVHYQLYDAMADWQVTLEDFFSDHKLIEFSLNFHHPETGPVKNWRLTDWKMFDSDLQDIGTAWVAPEYWNNAVLEAELDSLNTDIMLVLEKRTPSFFPARRLKRNSWWTAELKIYRNHAKHAWAKWSRSGEVVDHESYLEAKRAYKSEVNKAKFTSWQTFCSDADSSKKLATLDKILQRNRNKTLGLISGATDPEGSIGKLLDEHFPGSLPDSDEVNGNHLVIPQTEIRDWLSPGKIRMAIAQFSPYKTPGFDNLKPIVLQHLPSPMLLRLGCLYEASLVLEYVPRQWRLSKAIFIPKTGKDDYAQPRSWRPISLMSFAFKTMERLLLWHLEETILKTKGMHKDQHAFRKGRSTETALSDTVDYLESKVLQKGFAVGAFLDIEGAFDNLLPDGILQSLAQRDTPKTLLGWFGQYLRNRKVQVDYKGVHVSRKLVRGTPQGGVLSPVLWNLSFDTVLNLFNEGPIKACGYADDLVLIARGPVLETLISNTQLALDRVTEWGTSQGLKFSASKSVAVVFTHRRKWTCDPLRMNGLDVPYSNTVKYLGITLDGRLNWKAHIQDKLKKAKIRLFQYKQVVGTTYGPSPLNMRWMFTGIIRPAFSYGAVVWWRAVKAADIMTKCQRLTRLALTTWGGFRRSTPTAALEIMGYLPPMDLYLEGQVAKTWHRIRNIRAEIWDGVGVGTARGHRRALTDILKDLPSHDYVWDEIPEFKKWTRHYDVDMDSLKHGTRTCSPIQCSTTGLRLNDRAGGGICITYNNDTVKWDKIPLGTFPTAFQAALLAIHRAAEMLVDLNIPGNITINCDSQAVLHALNNPVAKSQTVLATMQILDTLAQVRTHRVRLTWIKALEGKTDSQSATLLAKEATELIPLDPEPVLPVSSNQFKTDIDAITTRKWDDRWRKLPMARQSKLFWPVVNKARSMELLRQSRQDFGWMVQLLTGHNYFNRHSSLVNDTQTSECRFCMEAEEDSEHLICKCPALEAERMRFLGSPRTDAATTSSMPLNAIRRFISMLCQRAEEGLDQN
ncbi:MAG: hypothetical protein KGI54_16055 [Pseudomonadota bacterium]|nr:hypothetical protein [Pseudomonadota bacterium]